jgi:hypothetical protein
MSDSSFAAALERQMCRLEYRTPAQNVRILVEPESPWARFKADAKVLHKEVAEVIELAFDEGAYVAGGCARWLRNNPELTPLLRGSYVKCGGDIDLFFSDEAAWVRFINKAVSISESEGSRLKLAMSAGKLAADIRFTENPRAKGSYSSAPNVQAICCAVGEPDPMLRGFDFLNAMVAFNRTTSWVAEGWDELEASKTLGVVWWGSRSIAHRVKKYVSKYGFTSMKDTSNGRMVEQLTAGFDMMSTSRKQVTQAVWREVVNCTSLNIPMVDKLTILTAASDGLGVKDIFDSAPDSPYAKAGKGNIGLYRSIIDDLVKRQEDARAQAARVTQEFPVDVDKWSSVHRVKETSDPPDFDAQEYCWAM